MSRLLAATEPVRTIVEQGGPAWWVPPAIALGVALVAALASYYATWRFKRADVNRENAFRVARIVDEAEQIISREERYEAEGGVDSTMRRLQEARVRAEPLEDRELNDRLKTADSFTFDVRLARDDVPSRTRYWLAEAVANVRAALVPHLSVPKFFRRRQPTERSFPTWDEFNTMPRGEGISVLLDALVAWRTPELAQEQENRTQ